MKRLIVKRELLPEINNAEIFINALQLSRILSSLRYNQIIYVLLIEKADINTSIQLNLLINHAALLCEGIKKFKTYEEGLRYLETYKRNIDNINKILSELANKNSFYNNTVCKARDKIAFHFDKRVITEVLEEFINEHLQENEDMVFVQGKTDLEKDTIHLLADNMNFRYILKSIPSKKLSYEEKFKILAKELLDLSKIFCDILESIIPELIQDYCELKETNE